jgi:excinuclease UvrABC nuclease subunit
MNNQKTAIYRHFDANNQLLYVGFKSIDISAR